MKAHRLQSFPNPSVKKDLSQGYPEALKNAFNIGLLHTCATGREGHESYAPCSLNGIKIYDGVYKKEKSSLDKFIGCSLDNTL